MTAIGFNFRDTLAYVTDDTGDYFVADTDTYPTTIGGVTAGWDANTVGRNRNSGIDARLAGAHQVSHVDLQEFRVDLDAATDHDIRVAFGDAGFTVTDPEMTLYDNTTLFQTLEAASTPAQDFLDATNVVRTDAADWVSNNAVYSHTFSSTIFKCIFGDGVTGGSVKIAHIEITQTGAGGAEAATPATGSLSLLGVGL